MIYSVYSVIKVPYTQHIQLKYNIHSELSTEYTIRSDNSVYSELGLQLTIMLELEV